MDRLEWFLFSHNFRSFTSIWRFCSCLLSSFVNNVTNLFPGDIIVLLSSLPFSPLCVCVLGEGPREWICLGWRKAFFDTVANELSLTWYFADLSRYASYLWAQVSWTVVKKEIRIRLVVEYSFRERSYVTRQFIFLSYERDMKEG